MATDSFAGTEQDINKQRADALATLAQFGRRGLEESVANARTANQSAADQATGTMDIAHAVRVPEGAGEAAIAAISDPVREAYKSNAAGRTAFLQGEQDAAAAVNSNYYNQINEAVPALRSSAAAIQEQYRSAYDERQAAVAHAEAMAQIQRQQILAQIEETQRRAALDAQIDAIRRASVLDFTPEEAAFLEALREQSIVRTRPLRPGLIR